MGDAISIGFGSFYGTRPAHGKGKKFTADELQATLSTLGLSIKDMIEQTAYTTKKLTYDWWEVYFKETPQGFQAVGIGHAPSLLGAYHFDNASTWRGFFTLAPLFFKRVRIVAASDAHRQYDVEVRNGTVINHGFHAVYPE